MRLVEVTGRPFIVWCMRCNTKLWASDVETKSPSYPVFVDLEGEAFKAYFCAECAKDLKEASCETK